MPAQAATRRQPLAGMRKESINEGLLPEDDLQSVMFLFAVQAVSLAVRHGVQDVEQGLRIISLDIVGPIFPDAICQGIGKWEGVGWKRRTHEGLNFISEVRIDNLRSHKCVLE